MRKFLATCCSALALLTISATAQPTRPSLTGIYDGNNQFIGTAAGEYFLIREYGGKPYLLTFDDEGFFLTALFYYTTTNCTGTAYLEPVKVVPRFARWDGAVVWTTEGKYPTTSITSNSYKYAGACYYYNETVPLLPAVALDSVVTATFKAPFTAK